MAFKMTGFSGPFKQQIFGGKKSVKKAPPLPSVPSVPSVPLPPMETRKAVKPIIRHYSNPVTRTVNQQIKTHAKQPIKRSSFKQVNEAGTEDASPGGGNPPKLKKKSKTIAQGIKDLELHKQTNTKEYKDLIAQVNKGYSEQGNYDEVD